MHINKGACTVMPCTPRKEGGGVLTSPKSLKALNNVHGEKTRHWHPRGTITHRYKYCELYFRRSPAQVCGHAIVLVGAPGGAGGGALGFLLFSDETHPGVHVFHQHREPEGSLPHHRHLMVAVHGAHWPHDHGHSVPDAGKRRALKEGRGQTPQLSNRNDAVFSGCGRV